MWVVKWQGREEDATMRVTLTFIRFKEILIQIIDEIFASKIKDYI